MGGEREICRAHRLQSMQCVFLRARAGSCETCDKSPHLAGPWHKAGQIQIWSDGVWFLCPCWMTAAFTQMEQEEENWLILVIAPICFSAVVNNFESAAENRPVNQCPIQILNLPVTSAARQTVAPGGDTWENSFGCMM